MFPRESDNSLLLNDSFELDTSLSTTDSIIKNSHSLDSTKLKELCRNPTILRNMIFCGCIWCGYIFNFYIIAFYLKRFPGNLYYNSFTMGGADMAGYLISALIIKKLSSGRSMILALVAASAGSILYLVLFTYADLVPLFIVLCRVGNGMLA